MWMALAVLAAASPAHAEVTERRENGFSLRFEASLTRSPAEAYAAMGRIGEWWQGAHTYGGDATALSLELKPGGCFCEALPGEPAGGVMHGRVIMAWPGRTLRLEAPLGPLQAMGPSAIWTAEWSAAEGATGGRMVWTFVVEGPGTAALADAVNGVMGVQFANYGRLLEASR
jgi:hypothetical protein